MLALLSKRDNFKYALHGLSQREEFLLQTILGVIDVRSEHSWKYDENAPDLWIVSDSESVLPTNHASQSANQIVLLNAFKNVETTPREDAVASNSLFSAFKIQQELNRVGRLLQQMRLLPVSQNPQLNQLEKSGLSAIEHAYRLKRWPATSALTSPLHTKVAALLLGVPLTVSEISAKSGYDLLFCEKFIQEMSTLGYINIIEMKPALVNQKYSTAVAMQSNLKSSSIELKLIFEPINIFKKIRNRLKLPFFTI